MKTVANQKLILSALLVILTWGSFSAILENDFVMYDDPDYITNNAMVRSGLNTESITWALTTNHTGNWIPVTWLSLMLDVQLFGLDPGLHHLSGLLIHCVNALLLFWLLSKTTGRMWAAFIAAALFALHPLRVESVAWASERKDVLSAFFGLLAIASYVFYVEKKKAAAYLLAAVFLFLGLMSKAMLVTWPFVFLLLDFWPLGRLHTGARFIKTARDLVIEKIPFFAAVLLFSVLAFNASKSSGAVHRVDYFPLVFRFENAVISYAAYIKMTLLPRGLALLYPLEMRTFTPGAVLACCVLLVGLTILFLRLRRGRPYLVTGWLWYIGTLVPVIGLVQVGRQAMADRYTYLPSIGLSIIAAFLLCDLALRGRVYRLIVSIGMMVIVCLLMVLTMVQCSYWKNSLTLFRHSLAATGDNYTMNMNYGYALANAREYDDAMEQFRRAHELIPILAEPLEKMGLVCADTGRWQQAVDYFQQALDKRNPDRVLILRKLGFCYIKLDQPAKALEYLQQACRLTQFKDKETLLTLLRILEGEPSLQSLLSKGFLDEVNRRAAELRK
ncbi:MAG: tetratricopeptide repeat protein [Planctomycetaceae bacterium]|nr:tetratricopeptide repeat protein [Planctomycetaceae bacterium]